MDELSRPDPSWETIERWRDAGPEKRAELHARVRATAEAEEYDDATAWQTIHAIRILALAGDTSLIEDLLDLCAAHGETDDDLWAVSIEAMRALASPELFDRYWKVFEAEEEADAADALITLLVACQVKTKRLRNELLNRFESFPEEFAVEVLESQDAAFIPHLEKHLHKIAPVVKYAPLAPDDPEEREWAEVGFAWFYLKKLSRVEPIPDWALAKPKKSWELLYRANEKELRRLEKEQDRAATEREEVLSREFLDPLPEEWDPLGEADFDDRIREILDEAEVEGEEAAKFAGVGRNDPCPCGSGQKFKKCHGA
jgi:hypothetical protein